MKRFFTLLLLANVLTFKVSAQLVDPAQTAQLERLNQSMLQLLQLMAKNNATADMNKVENYDAKLLSKDNLNLAKEAEKKLWKVDSYLKKGREINDILDREARIIARIRDLQRVFNQPGMSAYRNLIMNYAYQYLDKTGKTVDMALNVVTDDAVRMDTEGRRDILKDINSNLMYIESAIQDLHSKAASLNVQQQNNQYYKDLRNKGIQEAKTINYEP